MKKNLIILKNLKYHDDMSEETLCFTADVWIGGYKAGYAKNGGYGGCTDVRGYDAKGRELIQFAQSQIEAMPPETVDYMGKTLTLNSTIDSYIDDLVSKMLEAKEEKRITTWINKKLPKGIVARDDEKVYFYPFNSIRTDEGKLELVRRIKQLRPNCEIVNKF
jgi:hypothetical protein